MFYITFFQFVCNVFSGTESRTKNLENFTSWSELTWQSEGVQESNETMETNIMFMWIILSLLPKTWIYLI